MTGWRGRTALDEIAKIPIPIKLKPPILVGEVVPLGRLNPNSKFEIPALGVSGILLYSNECRAKVKINSGKKLVEFHDHQKGWQSFEVDDTKTTNWSPGTLVVKSEDE